LEYSDSIPLIKSALKKLLSFYDTRVDVDGLIDDQVIALEEPDAPERILKQVLDSIDFKTKITSLNSEEIAECELPVMVCVEGDFYIHLPQQTHEGLLYKIGEGKQESTLDELYEAQDVFQVLLITPPLAAEENVLKQTLKELKQYDWFWDEFHLYKPNLLEVALCTLFMNVFALALPLYTMNIYDRVVVSFAESTLFALTIGVVIVIGFDFMFRFVRSYALESISAKLTTAFDMKLMDRILSIRSAQMGMSVGELSNMFRELQGVKNFFTIPFVSTLLDLPFFFLFVLIIYILSPVVALVPIVGAALIIASNIFSYHLVQQSTQKHISILQSKNRMLVEMLSGVGAMQSSGLLGNRMLRWKRFSSDSARLLRKHNIITAFSNSISTAVSYLVQVFVVFVGVYQISGGSLTIGGLIACSIMSGRAMGPVMRLPDLVANTRKSLEVLKLSDKLFAEAEDKQRALSPKGPFEGRLDIRNVQFQYPKQHRAALQNISLSIQAGEKVGIIGMSGAGKTTLASLITGMAPLTEGEVLIDDYHIGLIPQTELKRTIGYLPQTPAFFEGTIRENIVMGRDIEDEELNQVMQVSGLQAVMKSTGIGVDAEVEPMGGNLSPGQKQTIAIARALVGDPDIILFDEPTNGMDNQLEAAMQNHIQTLIAGKTFLLITHKTTLLPLVDRLIVFNQGKIVLDGPRDEILQKLSKPAS
jgi:ATP-binding cassette subfamily C protein LapB